MLPNLDKRFFKISKQFEVKYKPRLILMTPEGVVLEGNAEKTFYQGQGEVLFENLVKAC